MPELILAARRATALAALAVALAAPAAAQVPAPRDRGAARLATGGPVRLGPPAPPRRGGS